MLRTLLLAQAAGALAVAAVAMLFGRLGPLARWPGPGHGPAGALAITASNFVTSARFASATPPQFRLSPWGRARLSLEEFGATMLNSSWTMPRAMPRTRIYPDSPVPPLLLLHGYGCNSGYWARLTPMLDAAHISHASIDMEPLLAGIDDFVPQVARAIESLCAASGAARVIVVGRSMGGLVARAYLRAHGEARIAHVFTLGTPHHGTALAERAPGANALQMRRWDRDAAPGVAWLETLAASETPRIRALLTSIYTHHDNIVSPQSSSWLPGARNIDIGGVGHVALGSNLRVLTRLLDEIVKITTF